MSRRFAALAAVLVILVAGCSGGGDPKTTLAPSSPPTTSSAPRSSPTPRNTSSTPARPTVPADVPRTGPNVKPGEKPPVMPLAATQHTPAGALAFAKFFVETIDWAYATTSTTYMKHYFQPSCVACRSTQLAVDKAAAQGHHFVGDRFINLRTTDGGIGGPNGAELGVVVNFTVTSVEVVDRKGNYVDAGPALPDYEEQVYLAWKRSAWTVVDMTPLG